MMRLWGFISPPSPFPALPRTLPPLPPNPPLSLLLLPLLHLHLQRLSFLLRDWSVREPASVLVATSSPQMKKLARN